MANRILITEPIIKDVINFLKEHHEVDITPRGRFHTEDDVMEVIGNYDAVLSMLSVPITEKALKAGKNLKIVANYAVGYNNIDVKAATNLGIKVANTPDVLTDASADGTMALILSVARRLCQAQDFLRDGKFDGWDPLGFLGMELKGKHLGVLGMGRIGQAVARRAKAFGLNILYHNRHRVTDDIQKELGAEYMNTVEDLAKNSDILSLNCPLNKETHHIINKEILDLMPDGSILINTSRGPVVDEEALADALHAGKLSGAGIDVFEEEPHVHPKLLSAPNCVLVPHIASATNETRYKMGMLAAHAIDDILNEKPADKIPNIIN
ncbi:MAG TPA: D-glycerate dehydrogenase [Balneolales bacterium]|nr:D-glycerate dehydrogenase [Balneolales bacterium]